MKKQCTLWILLISLLLFALMAQAEGLTITDDMGREVRIDKTPATCVSITPANTETLFALGLQDKIIGVDNQSDYPEAAQSIPKVGDYYTPNVETIVALKPDVVFASAKFQAEVVSQLESLGLTVVCNEPTKFEDIISGIEMIANVMGVDATQTIKAITDAVTDTQIKVYYAVSFGEYGNYSAGPGTFIDEMITMCKGTNVAQKSPVAWPEYSMEQLVLDDPDLILVSDDIGNGSVVEKLMQDPGFASLRCVKQGNVYAVDANLVSRPGPRIGEGLLEISKAIRQTLQNMQ